MQICNIQRRHQLAPGGHGDMVTSCNGRFAGVAVEGTAQTASSGQEKASWDAARQRQWLPGAPVTPAVPPSPVAPQDLS